MFFKKYPILEKPFQTLFLQQRNTLCNKALQYYQQSTQKYYNLLRKNFAV